MLLLSYLSIYHMLKSMNQQEPIMNQIQNSMTAIMLCQFDNVQTLKVVLLKLFYAY